jgi:peptidoglycan hydrolase-like protein with peptidoglycan-binding domain
VSDARGEAVGTGQVNDPPLPLVEGVYTVEVAADPPITADAEIAVDRETRVLLNKEGESVGVEIEQRDLALASPTPDQPSEVDVPTGPDGQPLPPAASLDPQELVREIQLALAERGLDPGPADGVIGPSTRDAIRAYQAAVGLPVDGRATAALLEDLRARPLAEATPPTQPESSIEIGSPVDRVAFFASPRTMYATQAARVRSGPGTDYEPVGGIPFAGRVTVLGELDGWLYLETADGLRGFTSGGLLSATQPSTSGGARPPPGPATAPSTPSNAPTCPPGQTPILRAGVFVCVTLQ